MAFSEKRFRARCRLFLVGSLLPPAYFSAIEHGQKLIGDEIARELGWQRMKAQGVKTGLADIFIWAPYQFLAIELKAGKNTTSPAQDEFAAIMRALGHGYEVCRSVAELGEAITRHNIPLVVNWRVQALHHDAALAADVRVPKAAAKPQGTRPTRKQIAKGNSMSLAMAMPRGQ